jgi:NAD-dependent deacetylase
MACYVLQLCLGDPAILCVAIFQFLQGISRGKNTHFKPSALPVKQSLGNWFKFTLSHLKWGELNAYLCWPMQHLVVFTGAGISAESGLNTFRDAGGLWEGHRIEDVASPEGFYRNPELVLNFYNQRRRQLDMVEPNEAHLLLAKMEDHFKVTVITQNVDDLHERGGSNNIIHLHGELRYACSSQNRSLRQYLGGKDILPGDRAPDGSALRPDIVWLGEAVPKMDEAIAATVMADIFLVIGTSLEVYPAASLINFVRPGKAIYIVDPNRHEERQHSHIRVISKKATDGMRDLYGILVADV